MKGARLIRTGMGDRVTLGDIEWAITEHGATVEEILAAVSEQIDRPGTPLVSGEVVTVPRVWIPICGECGVEGEPSTIIECRGICDRCYKKAYAEGQGE